MKSIITWLVALVAMASLSASSAYLAFEASPAPMILQETIPVEVFVEVPASYEESATLYVTSEGEITDDPNAPDVLYKIIVSWDDSPLVAELTLYLPLPGDTGLKLTIAVPGGRASFVVEFLIDDPEEEGF